MAEHFDVIVVGSGPGGASFAQKLAASGKRILILERGDYLPRTQGNWDADNVFMRGTYQATENWQDKDGKIFHPGLHYFVGGNSKVYGAALLRLREQDFGEIRHEDGISPAWPLGYGDFAPWYDEAEALFEVHGLAGEDPSEPPRGAYPHPPVSHEPVLETLASRFARNGLHPFHLPLGIKLREAHGRPTPESVCIRCDAFDGFPCLLNGKADAQVMCVDPALAKFPNLELRTRHYVKRLITDSTGRSIRGVEVEHAGETQLLTADIVVAAAGALSSALLFLRSANEAHPQGLANGSDQVGRNYMRHNQSVLMALMRQPNDAVFQKTLALPDFYFSDRGEGLPLGFVQMCAKVHPGQIISEAVPSWLHWLPRAPFAWMARHAIDFWLSTEDLPRPENRILYKDGQVRLEEPAETNMGAHHRLVRAVKREFAAGHRLFAERLAFFSMPLPLSGTSHQAGTMRFGPDPANAVLDLNCKTHELDNLYVVDASFFPSIGAVNPTLTIIANALRVAAHVQERLG